MAAAPSLISAVWNTAQDGERIRIVTFFCLTNVQKLFLSGTKAGSLSSETHALTAAAAAAAMV